MKKLAIKKQNWKIGKQSGICVRDRILYKCLFTTFRQFAGKNSLEIKKYNTYQTTIILYRLQKTFTMFSDSNFK